MSNTNTFINHYATLGFQQIASIDEVKTAYKALVKRYHPDINPSIEAQEIMKAINSAYEILSRQQTKAIYDKQYKAYCSPNQNEKQQTITDNYNQKEIKPSYFNRVFSCLIVLFTLKIITFLFNPNKSNTIQTNNSFETKSMREDKSEYNYYNHSKLVIPKQVKPDSEAQKAFFKFN